MEGDYFFNTIFEWSNENAIRGGPNSGPPPSEIFENAIWGGPNKEFPPPKILKKWNGSPHPINRSVRVSAPNIWLDHPPEVENSTDIAFFSTGYIRP